SILTKGQVGIIYFAMIFLGFKFFNKEDYSLKVFLSPFLWIVAFLVSGWWFIAVGIKHQGLLQYLFFREAVEASYSSKRFHPGPFYYYIPVMLGGLFPFWLLFPSLKNLITDRKIKSLFGYTIFPLVLFSFFPAKLPTYLLPSTPGWALLFNERKEKKQFLQMISIIMSIFLICISFLIYSQGEKYVGKNLKEVSLILIVGSLFSLFAFIASYRKSEFVVITALFVSILFSSLSIPTLVAKNQEKFKIAQEMALSIKEKIQKEDEVLELRTTIFSVPFYLQKKVYAFDNNFFRKKFLKDKPEHILQTEEELNEFIGKTPLLWVIVDRKSENYLRENYPQYQPYFKGSRYIVYVSPEIKRRLGD
ncbi:MAG: hypothetical protein N2445_08570, partial [Acidobacteria bacterium]|nr:hypothetical protein [Acidobacteriota bacterium]